MCDVKAFVKKDEGESLVLEAVTFIRAEGGEVVLRNLFGEERRVPGTVKEVSLSKNRLTIEQP